MNPRSSLPDRWRSKAEELRELGAGGQACTFEFCAAELEAALDTEEGELLTVTQVADVLDVCEETVRRRVRKGALPAERNGDQGQIHIRRGDVGSCRRSRVETRQSDDYDVDEDARNIAQQLEGQR